MTVFGSQWSVLDPDVRPRLGQKVTVDYLGQKIQGQISAASGVGLEIRPESLNVLGHVRADARLRVAIIARNGVSEVVLTGLAVRGDVLTGQLVGHAVMVQRRAHERVEARLAATLVWFPPQATEMFGRHGRTENLSVGGALLRFPDPGRPLPCQDTVAMLGLRLPGLGEGANRGADPGGGPGPGDGLALCVRVLHAWEDGARIQVVDAAPRDTQRLKDFVRSQLHGGR